MIIFGPQLTLGGHMANTKPQSTLDTKIAIQAALDQTRRKYQRQVTAVKNTEQLIIALEYQLEQLSK